MPLGRLPQQRPGRPALHRQPRLRRGGRDRIAADDEPVAVAELLGVQVVGDRPDLPQVEHRLRREPADELAGEHLLVGRPEPPAEPRAAHRLREPAVAADRDRLAPAERLGDRALGRGGDDLVGRPLGERERQAGRGAQVAARADVDEPPLLSPADQLAAPAARGVERQEGVVHPARHVVAGEQVAQQRPELPAGVVRPRPPVGRGADEAGPPRGAAGEGGRVVRRRAVEHVARRRGRQHGQRRGPAGGVEQAERRADRGAEPPAVAAAGDGGADLVERIAAATLGGGQDGVGLLGAQAGLSLELYARVRARAVGDGGAGGHERCSWAAGRGDRRGAGESVGRTGARASRRSVVAGAGAGVRDGRGPCAHAGLAGRVGRVVR